MVQARAPLFINNTGTIALDQSQIVQVGQLVAGSISRAFGEALCAKKMRPASGVAAKCLPDSLMSDTQLSCDYPGRFQIHV